MAWRPTAEYLADEGRNIFIGPMNGGLWNDRILDACIMSKKEGDNAAYEFLLKFGDQYASTLSAEQQHQWQNVKGKGRNSICLKSRKNSESFRGTFGIV